VKREVSNGQNREEESIDAEQRDGAARSSDEGPVITQTLMADTFGSREKRKRIVSTEALPLQ